MLPRGGDGAKRSLSLPACREDAGQSPNSFPSRTFGNPDVKLCTQTVVLDPRFSGLVRFRKLSGPSSEAASGSRVVFWCELGCLFGGVRSPATVQRPEDTCGTVGSLLHHVGCKAALGSSGSPPDARELEMQLVVSLSAGNWFLCKPGGRSGPPSRLSGLN